MNYMNYMSEIGAYSSRKIYYINLTRHPASPEQVEAGVVDLQGEDHDELVELLTFNELPSGGEIFSRAIAIAELAKKNWKFELGDSKNVMIGGAPYLMGMLEAELELAGFTCYYAFTKRVVEEKDGVKKSIFKHVGFVMKVPSPNDD